MEFDCRDMRTHAQGLKSTISDINCYHDMTRSSTNVCTVRPYISVNQTQSLKHSAVFHRLAIDERSPSVSHVPSIPICPNNPNPHFALIAPIGARMVNRSVVGMCHVTLAPNSTLRIHTELTIVIAVAPYN